METAWRVLDTGAGGAAWNMAVDEALLLMAEKGQCVPTLRFFAWERASLSIGSFQKVDELDLARVASEGVPLVRRPTGGRAVLHGAELTYSVTCPIPSAHFPSDLMGSYKRIGACFLQGLNGLGVEAALVPVSKNPDRKPGKSYTHNPLCFSSPSWHEVLLDGRKLVGSAQRRLKGAFLQQGSLLMELDIEGIVSLMKFADDDARRAAAESLASKMTALGEVRPGISIEALKAAIVGGFEAEMGVRFVAGGLAEEEAALAGRLLREKYGRADWNLYRK
ncbi:MAG: lipoate--protein ligase family protein [Nitrospirae bacterium]|nr:lipoate--protein ligase family protein [Nitrospirota bacterium]